MNTFGMKVKARCFIEYDSVADLVDIEFSELARPVLHIGGGSNLLFTGDFKGTVLHSKINFIEILDDASYNNSDGPVSCHFDQAKRVEKSASDVFVSVGAGVVFDDFCAWAAQQGLWGVENLSYIPGEVGASAVQNIGAYGVEVKDAIHKVYCYDTVEEEFVSFSVDECGYGYRDSIFKKPEIKGRYIVTHVVFALSREPMPRLDYGHLREAVTSAYGECHSVSETPSQLSPGPSPYPVNHPKNQQIFGDPDKVGKCPLHTDGTSPGSSKASSMHYLTPAYVPDNRQSQHQSGLSQCHSERSEESVTPALIRKVIIRIRKEKLPEPSVTGSAGSFFKNPVISMEHFRQIEAASKAEHGPDYKVPHYVIPGAPSVISNAPSVISNAPSVISNAPSVISSEVEKSVKVPAAWLIEQCGWKGRRSGGAAVWDKQPLVIVNYTGDAYPEEIIGLERRIIDSVRQKFGVELHPEVEHI